MLSRKAQFIPLAILIVAVLGFGLWLCKAPPLYSSPTAPRNNESYLRAHAPGTNVSPLPANFFDSLTIGRGVEEITVANAEALNIFDRQMYGPIEDHQADSSQTVRIGEGLIRLEYLATGYAAPPTNFDFFIFVPANYYKPDLKPAPKERLPENLDSLDGQLLFHGAFPAAQFFFTHSNLPPLKPLWFEVFDAHTQFSLCRSGEPDRSMVSNCFSFGESIGLWHQTPLELLVAVATGLVETYTFEPREGAEIRHSGGGTRLLFISEDASGSWSSEGISGGLNVISFQKRVRDESEPREPQTSFVFYSWPPVDDAEAPIEFEFIGEDGMALPSRGGGAGIEVVSVEADLKQIKQIRLHRYPNIHRLAFAIPELPGLPEQNRNVKNLFDVHVPYFASSLDFRKNLASLIQMDESLPYKEPDESPNARKNTTPRVLFREMASRYSDRENRLVADPVANEIKIVPRTIGPVIQAVKEKLGLSP